MEVMEFKSKGFSEEGEMIYLAEKHGLRTVEVATAAGAVVVSHEVNKGYGAAMVHKSNKGCEKCKK